MFGRRPDISHGANQLQALCGSIGAFDADDVNVGHLGTGIRDDKRRREIAYFQQSQTQRVTHRRSFRRSRFMNRGTQQRVRCHGGRKGDQQDLVYPK